MLFDPHKLAQVVDRIPITPANLAGRALGNLSKLRRQRAKTAPSLTYAPSSN